MKNKKIVFTAFLFFAGALLTLLLNIIGIKFYFDYLNAYSATGDWAEKIAADKFQKIIGAILRFIFSILPGIFLMLFSSTKSSVGFSKIRALWVGIFAFYVTNALYWPIARFCWSLIPVYYPDTVRLFHLAVEESLGKVLLRFPLNGVVPFFQDIKFYIFNHNQISPVNMVLDVLLVFVSDLIILTGFIKGTQVLNQEVKNQSVEPEVQAVPAQQNENPAAVKTTGFFQAIKTCFKKSFSFKGCASRSEYWYFILFCYVILILLFVFSNIMLTKYMFSAYRLLQSIFCIFSLIIMPAIVSAGVRRMHDAGKRGFFIAIPIVSFIIALMPSAESSEYRDGKVIHSISNAIGMSVLIFISTIYLFYVIQIIHIVWERF